MTVYRGRTVFRSARWMVASTAAAAALFAAGAWFFLRRDGLGLTAILFVVLTAIGVLGIVETLLQRIVLSGDALRIHGLKGRREYPRADIGRVSHEKGTPVVVQLKSGGFVKLPDLGLNAQSVTNSIRAWAKARDNRD